MTKTRHKTCIQKELKRFVSHYKEFGRIKYENYLIEKIDLSKSLNTYIKNMEKGLCTSREYKYMKDNILLECPVNLLVFGVGEDFFVLPVGCELVDIGGDVTQRGFIAICDGTEQLGGQQKELLLVRTKRGRSNRRNIFCRPGGRFRIAFTFLDFTFVYVSFTFLSCLAV